VDPEIEFRESDWDVVTPFPSISKIFDVSLSPGTRSRTIDNQFPQFPDSSVQPNQPL
jgi:hypothetical protein